MKKHIEIIHSSWGTGLYLFVHLTLSNVINITNIVITVLPVSEIKQVKTENESIQIEEITKTVKPGERGFIKLNFQPINKEGNIVYSIDLEILITLFSNAIFLYLVLRISK